MNKPIFKAHPSELGKIMTNPRSKSELLSVTCLKVVDSWMKQQLYGTRFAVQSKYLDKGNECEQAAIDLVNKVYGWNATKNDETKEDDYFIGTSDSVLPDRIIDYKNSWSDDTFPLFDDIATNKDYIAQGYGYLHLWKKENYSLIYTLMDAPTHLIEREAWAQCRKLGYDELDFEIFQEYEEKMTYSRLPDWLRVKRFDFVHDPKFIELAIERIILIREYIEQKTNFYKLYEKLIKQ